jgi:hypothetical protein
VVDVGTSPASEDLRCAPWTLAQGVDPVGSAGVHDTFLLVESPLPWPEDVSGIDALAAVAGRDPRTRVLAVIPRTLGDDGLRRVVRWRRRGTNRFEGTDHLVPPAALPWLLEDLLADPDGAHPTEVGPAPPDVVVCGHGRRDRCCGRWGTLLQVEAAARWTDVRVWRGSHTGGHRYAPTGVTFPDGRMWAFLDVDVLDAVVGRTGDPRRLRLHHRGTTALDPRAQAVEREVFEALGWGWLDHDLTGTSVEEAGDGRSAEVTLEWDGPTGPGRARATVVVTRDVPVLVCGRPPEEATKTSPELAVTDLEVTST